MEMRKYTIPNRRSTMRVKGPNLRSHAAHAVRRGALVRVGPGRAPGAFADPLMASGGLWWL